MHRTGDRSTFLLQFYVEQARDVNATRCPTHIPRAVFRDDHTCRMFPGRRRAGTHSAWSLSST